MKIRMIMMSMLAAAVLTLSGCGSDQQGSNQDDLNTSKWLWQEMNRGVEEAINTDTMKITAKKS